MTGAAPLAPLAPSHPTPPLVPLALGVVLGAMAPMALAFATGWEWCTPALAWWCCGLPLGIAAALALARWPLAATWLLFGAAALLGGALAGAPRAPGADTRLVALRGEVVMVAWQGSNQGFALAPDEVETPAGWPPPRRVFVRAPMLPTVRPGDAVAVRGVWSEDGRGQTVKAVEVSVLRLREDGPRGFAWHALERVGEHRELAESYLLGQGDPPEKPLFRQAGLLHILAVSGMHLAIAAALGAWLLRLAGVGWLARLGALAVLFVGYTWLTGASPAAVRACAMGLALALFQLAFRKPHRLAAVALAALALVVWEPALACDLGFQLSLAAVLSLLTLGMDLIDLRRRRLPLAAWPLDRPTWRALLFGARAAIDGLLIGAAAGLGTAPLVAWHFHNATPWGWLATALATPPSTVALWVGLPLLPLAGAWPDGPWEGLYRMLEWSLDALVWAAETGAGWGGLVPVGPPPLAVALLWPFLFLRLRDGRDLAWRAAAVAMALLAWRWC